MLENAVRICDAKFGNIYRWDGDALHLVLTQNAPTAFAERRRLPHRADPQAAARSHDRSLAKTSAVHVADAAAEQAYMNNAIRPTSTAVELAVVLETFLTVPMLEGEQTDRCVYAIPTGSSSLHRQADRTGHELRQPAVIAIENARLLNELREVASTADRHRRRAQGHQPLDI